MSFPSSLDTFPTKIDVTDTIFASHVNVLQNALEAIEIKVGINSSADSTSIDYLLKSTSSVDPGHKHSNTSLNSLAFSKLTFSGLTSGHALMASGASAASFRALLESDIADGSILARLASNETVTGLWTFGKRLTVVSSAVDSTLRGVRIVDFESGGYVELRAQPGALQNVALYLPTEDGTAGQSLVTDGSGNLSWASNSATVPSGSQGETLWNDSGSWIADDTVLVEADAVSLKMGSNGCRLRWKTKTSVAALSSGATVTLASFIPANVLCLGFTFRINTSISGSPGGVKIGDLELDDRYGTFATLTSGTVLQPKDGRFVSPFWTTEARDVVFEAQGGNFSGGAIRVTLIYAEIDDATA